MSDAGKNTVTLMAGGDIGPVHEPTEQFAELITPLLRQADIRFGQCERSFSERGTEPHWARGPGGEHSRQHPRMAGLWKAAGIDVISVASNHTPDWGPDALMDTVDLFRGMGKHVVGAGRNEAEARTPAIVERNGVKIAFLAYCSVLRDGQAAVQEKPGIAPMRAYTYYLPEDSQPGTPPTVMSVPYEEDIAALQADIRKAKQQADVVIMSIHWGLHHVTKTICDYQQPVAHAAIDAGADLILGHHAHSIKAVEVYKGKVCFYSLSNLIMSRPEKNAAQAAAFAKKHGIPLDPDYPRLPYGLDSKRGLIAKVLLSKDGVKRVSFLPLFVDKQLRPEVLHNGDPRFEDALKYMEWISEEYEHKFVVDGDEIVVTGA